MALVAMYATSTWAYDFSAVAPTGQTLYYKIVSENAQVVNEDFFFVYSTYPTGDLTIPDSVTFNDITYAVTSIGSYAFRDCSGLTSVTIPDGVTSIGCDAFSNCSRLTSINIPDGVTSIDSFAFYGCISLTSITIPNSATFMGNFAFCNCSGLTSVTISDSITSIGIGVFARCSSLTSVTIPDGVTSIDFLAFAGCSSLTSVTIPDGVTSIGSSVFSNCIGLTSVTIGNNVTTIGNYAFERCNSLTSVTIPNSVISIGKEAFWCCSALTSVTIGNGVSSIGNRAFIGCIGLRVMRMKPATPPTLSDNSSICDSIIDLVVPHNSYFAYIEAGDYYTRHHIFRDSAFVTITVNDNAGGYVSGCANDTVFTYPYSGTAEIELVAIPYNGYHFVRWDNNNTDSIRTITNIIHNITVTAYFAIDTHTVVVMPNDIALGTVTSTDSVIIHGQPCTVEATAYTGYTFACWSNGVTDNPYTFTVMDNIVLTAIFVDQEGIDDVETLNAKVYSSQRQIVVEGAEGNMVTLYDVNGRMLTAKQDYDMPLRFDVPVSGTYLVKIGNHPAKKVIVVR